MPPASAVESVPAPAHVVSGAAAPVHQVHPRAPIADEVSVVAARPRSRKRVILLSIVLAVGGGLGGYGYVQRGIEQTDDAQVDADLVAVPARTAGVIAQVHFRENQAVKAGTLLAELDAIPLKVALAQSEAALAAAQAAADGADAEAELAATQALGNQEVARAILATSSAGARASQDEIREGEAQVATAEAQQKQALLDLERAESLFSRGAFTKAQHDQAATAKQVADGALAVARARLSSLHLARAQSQSRVVEASAKLKVSDSVQTLIRQAKARAASAHAQVETARAARDMAALELSYTQILAPHDGIVSKKSINEGQAVGRGQTIVQLVPSERWVTANFKETQLARMKPGQTVKLTADAFPDAVLEGEVQSFSGATGARFSLLPPDNATGNFTKVVQRVPVRIRLHDLPAGVALRPGMSVEVSVDTNEG
jgi:membrane fusion protein, multidrug efflux system